MAVMVQHMEQYYSNVISSHSGLLNLGFIAIITSESNSGRAAKGVNFEDRPKTSNFTTTGKHVFFPLKL